MARATRPKDARAGRMLAVDVGIELLAALRDEAARREQPLAVVVRRLLADGLQGARDGVAADPGRLEALEAIVAALSARVTALEQPAAEHPAAQDGALVTVDLARLLGLTPAALNKVAAAKGIGARHRSGWVVVARVPAPTGPDRWLWSPPPA